MARQPWVAQIRNSRNPADQVVALKNLKNEVIGHPIKKEMVVALGLLDPIVRLSSTKTAIRQDGKSHDHTFASRPLSEEEMVRLQSLHVIASIALGELSCSFDRNSADEITRRPIFSRSSTICIRVACCSFESLSNKQPLSAGASFTARSFKSCRLV